MTPHRSRDLRPGIPADDHVDQRAFVRMGTLLGRHAPLVWFWDYTNLNSLRALPYLLEWHRRYAPPG